MNNCEILLGRGTKVRVFRMTSCDLVAPEVFTITTAASAIKGATSLTITELTLTKSYEASASAPIYLAFTDALGYETLVKVTSDIIDGATTLTVAELPRAIASGATANIPCLLRGRESANLTSNNKQTEINTFDQDGWFAEMTTQLGKGFTANGYLSLLNDGFNHVQWAELNNKLVYLELELPTPHPDIYAIGPIYKGFANIKGVPIDIGSPVDPIKSNLEFTFYGEVTVVEPEVI